MTGKQIKIPGPDHPIEILPFVGKVIVRSGEEVIAETSRALKLSEASYPSVFYIPRADADMALLERTTRETYCPYKGDASYFSLRGAENGANAVWSYEAPYDAVAAIKDHLAFYPERVQIEIAD
jgi:uncharacterized protein (DUF427 family)